MNTSTAISSERLALQTTINRLFYEHNGMWKERLEEYKKFNIQASAIARLITACETGNGVDQHASEDLKYISSQLVAMESEVARQAAELADLREIIAALEWDEATGECLLGCGGYADGGHNRNCLYTEVTGKAAK